MWETSGKWFQPKLFTKDLTKAYRAAIPATKIPLARESQRYMSQRKAKVRRLMWMGRESKRVKMSTLRCEETRIMRNNRMWVKLWRRSRPAHPSLYLKPATITGMLAHQSSLEWWAMTMKGWVSILDSLTMPRPILVLRPKRLNRRTLRMMVQRCSRREMMMTTMWATTGLSTMGRSSSSWWTVMTMVKRAKRKSTTKRMQRQLWRWLTARWLIWQKDKLLSFPQTKRGQTL